MRDSYGTQAELPHLAKWLAGEEDHRWEYHDTHLLVDAGEDIRWLPRRLVSALAFPGNDFWLFDQETVVFTILAGNGLVVERQRTTDPVVVWLCKSSFGAAWPLSIPHHQYQLS
jgi:hypothetical protein